MPLLSRQILMIIKNSKWWSCSKWRGHSRSSFKISKRFGEGWIGGIYFKQRKGGQILIQWNFLIVKKFRHHFWTNGRSHGTQQGGGRRGEKDESGVKKSEEESWKRSRKVFRIIPVFRVFRPTVLMCEQVVNLHFWSILKPWRGVRRSRGHF